MNHEAKDRPRSDRPTDEAASADTLVSVTYLRLRGLSALPPFLRLSGPSIREARSAPGNRGVRTRARGPLSWYTMTAWEDEEAMKAYVRGPAHLDAMRATRDLTVGTAIRRTTLAGPLDQLGWRAAFALFDEAPSVDPGTDAGMRATGPTAPARAGLGDG